MTGPDGPDPLVVGTVIVGMARQMRVEERIARGEHAAPFPGEAGRVEILRHGFPAGEFMMDQRRARRVDRAQPGAMGAQAEIQVVVDDVVRLVETAQMVEHGAADEQAGAGDGDHLPPCQREAEIPRIVFRGIAEGVAADTVAQKHAGVLDSAVGIQQAGARDGGAVRHFLQQGVEPAGFDDLHIVVEEQQELPVGGVHGAVVETRPVERHWHVDDFIGVRADEGFPHRLPARDVIDADDLVILVRGQGAQAGQTGLDMAFRGTGRDDDRHLAGDGCGAPRVPCVRHAAGKQLGGDAPARQGAGQGGGILVPRALVPRALVLRTLILGSPRLGSLDLGGGGAIGAAEQIAQMVDEAGVLGATQHEIVCPVAHQRGRCRANGGQRPWADHERTADIIGGQ